MTEVYLGNRRLLLRANQAFPPGREGTVYRDPSDPDFVIKLAHTPDTEWCDKLRAMLTIPLNAPDVAWPTEVVFASDRTTIIGYRMPFAAKKHSIMAVISTDPATRWLNADYGFRLDVAINLATAIERVHRHGCVVGDISLTNILVGTDGSVCLIDTDSFQITQGKRTFRCLVGTPDYTPSELHGPRFEDVHRTEHHDAFGLAVMIFQLLVGPGTHPFAARYTGNGTPLTLTDRIRLGIWAYAPNNYPDYLPRTAAPLDLLHPLLQPLVCRCFQDGHSHPETRPTPSVWLLALREARQDMDFVRVIAPQLEAQCHNRQRQAVLAALSPQTWSPGIPPLASQPCVAPRRRWLNRKVLVVPIAASLLLAAVSVFVLTPARSRIDYVPKAQHLLPAPGMYQSLSVESTTPPPHSPSTPGSLPTPRMYQHIAEAYQ